MTPGENAFVARIRRERPEVIVLAVATMLHEGWELDNYVALVQDGEDTLFLGTMHGAFLTYTTQELVERVAKMQKAAASLEALMAAHPQA